MSLCTIHSKVNYETRYFKLNFGTYILYRLNLDQNKLNVLSEKEKDKMWTEANNIGTFTRMA